MSGEVLPGAEGLPELGKHNFQGAPGDYPGGSVASVQEMSPALLREVGRAAAPTSVCIAA